MKNLKLSEMLENKQTKLPFNLQFFAESGSDEEDGDGAGGSEGGSEDDDQEDDEEDHNEKKFTQADMTATATKEKKQGRKSAFKDLGFSSEKEAKEEIEQYRKWKQDQLTPEQKKQKEIDDANSGKSDAEKRAQEAEEKLAVVIAGVRKDSIDDVLAIARVKVTEDKSLDDVLAEMKKEDRYKSFFDSSEDAGSKGTGGSLGRGSKGSSGKDENIGARLGKQRQAAKDSNKKTYFN